MSQKFEQSAAIVKGAYTPPPQIAELLDWINQTYSVSALNITFQTRGTEYCQYIYIWFLRMAESKKMTAGTFMDHIGGKILEVVLQPGQQEALAAHGSILLKRRDKMPSLYINYISMEGTTLYNAFALLQKDFSPITKKFPDLFWKFTTDGNRVVAFLHTDALFEKCHVEGVLDEVRKELLAMLKVHDTLNVLTLESVVNSEVILFDSKERFDKEFGGADWMYFR